MSKHALFTIAALSTGAIAFAVIHAFVPPAQQDVPRSVDDSGADASADAEEEAIPALPLKLNVILVTIDTLRADAVGFMGYPHPTTPNLDALAARSVVFDRAYSLASYTGKSVGPMLIGKYPSETDRDGNHFTIYAPSNVFLAERLHDAGVRTFGAAAHWYFQSWSGLAQGMDVWDTSARLDGRDTAVTSVELSNEAIKLLANPENTGRQFFAWFHYFDPHNKYMPHAGAPDMLGDASSPVAGVRALYDGEVWFTDRELGRVLDFIDQQPFAERTAIIVTSDHGEAFGEHGMSWHGLDLWEPLVRVPLLVHVPRASSHRVPVRRSLIDIAPTVLELMGIDAPEGQLSGKSLVADLRASDDYESRSILLDMPASPYTAMRRAWISGEMKLIDVGAHTYRLYDLARDAQEREDLATDRERLAPIVAELDRAWSGLKTFDVPPAPP